MPSHESPGNCKLWGEEESVFFKSVAPDKLHVPVEGHIYKNIWAAQIDLDGEKKNAKLVGREREELGEGGYI